MAFVLFVFGRGLNRGRQHTIVLQVEFRSKIFPISHKNFLSLSDGSDGGDCFAVMNKLNLALGIVTMIEELKIGNECSYF